MLNCISLVLCNSLQTKNFQKLKNKFANSKWQIFKNDQSVLRLISHFDSDN